jgi:multimeric flavodoxin WrbA
MKLIGIATSPRKNKTTHFALDIALTAAKEANSSLETELIQLAGLTINPCIACGYCRDNFECAVKSDDFLPIMEKLKDPNVKGLLLATPVYMGSMSAQAKALLDRTVLFRRNNFHFKNIVGGAIAVGGSRNGGQELALRSIHNAMLIHDMIVVGDGVSTAHFGGTGWQRAPQGIDSDPDSLDTFKGVGKRMAEVMQKMHS